MNIEDGAVQIEWMESHNCEGLEAQEHVEDCEAEDCATCRDHKEEYGEYPGCACEVFQWYAIDVSDSEAERLNKNYTLDIFYSDTLDMHILPVYHFGTAWSGVSLSKRI